MNIRSGRSAGLSPERHRADRLAIVVRLAIRFFGVFHEPCRQSELSPQRNTSEKLQGNNVAARFLPVARLRKLG
jgi:hypothetical protein